jgi:hypothetical protein
MTVLLIVPRRDLLLGTSPGKDHPAVECCRPTLAPAAGPNSEIGGRTFDHIANPDFLIVDESRQAHSVSRDVAPVRDIEALSRLFHATLDLAAVVERIS